MCFNWCLFISNQGIRSIVFFVYGFVVHFCMFLLLLLLFSLMGYSDCSDTIDHQMTLFNLYKIYRKKCKTSNVCNKILSGLYYYITSLNIMQNIDLKHTTVNFK